MSSKLLHDTCSISQQDSAAQRETGHTRSHLKIWGVGTFDIASYPTEWWIALRGAIKAAEAAEAVKQAIHFYRLVIFKHLQYLLWKTS